MICMDGTTSEETTDTTTRYEGELKGVHNIYHKEIVCFHDILATQHLN